MKNQHKLISISILGTVLFLGLVLFVVKPSLNKVAEMNKEISVKKTELRQLEEQIVIYKNSQKDLLLASGKDMISSILLPRENLHLAIEEMEAAAQATGVGEFLKIKEEADSLVPNIVVPGKVSLDEVEYTITTYSGFEQLINFLKHLEHLPHFTEISKISIYATPSPGEDASAANLGPVNGVINSVFFVRKK